MPKKFVPTPEQLELILTRYKETHNYSLISRETGLSVAIIKRIIQEAELVTEEKTTSEPKKPKTAAQTLALNKEYQYTGLPPIESICPKKAVYYGQISMLVQEFLNV